MSQNPESRLYGNLDPASNRPEEFLSPEQHLDAVAEILADIALRAIKADREDTNV